MAPTSRHRLRGPWGKVLAGMPSESVPATRACLRATSLLFVVDGVHRVASKAYAGRY